MASRIVKASEFKTKCLKLMDEVAASGETIIVTKNGRPPHRCDRPRQGRPLATADRHILGWPGPLDRLDARR
jgi:antitoxin (DNA-binding transcriptional repressor) of toxin-antitoxin stability system